LKHFSIGTSQNEECQKYNNKTEEQLKTTTKILSTTMMTSTETMTQEIQETINDSLNDTLNDTLNDGLSDTLNDGLNEAEALNLKTGTATSKTLKKRVATSSMAVLKNGNVVYLKCPYTINNDNETTLLRVLFNGLEYQKLSITNSATTVYREALGDQMGDEITTEEFTALVSSKQSKTVVISAVSMKAVVQLSKRASLPIGKKRRNTIKKGDNSIKKPVTARSFFLKSHFAATKGSGKSLVDTSKEIALLWNGMCAEDRAVFVVMAEVDKNRYKEEVSQATTTNVDDEQKPAKKARTEVSDL
jgi:hypothetical protein